MFKLKVELPSLDTVTVPLKTSHSQLVTLHATTESEHTPAWLPARLITPVPRPLKGVIAEVTSGTDAACAGAAESAFTPNRPSSSRTPALAAPATAKSIVAAAKPATIFRTDILYPPIMLCPPSTCTMAHSDTT